MGSLGFFGTSLLFFGSLGGSWSGRSHGTSGQKLLGGRGELPGDGPFLWTQAFGVSVSSLGFHARAL